MAQTRSAGDSSEPEGPGGVPDAPDMWGNGGLVGDGRYRLTHRLGRGGMAEVFAAEDVRLGRTVAVKLLRSDLAEDPISKARFTREAQSVAGLNHHAVVAVYDSGEDVVAGGTVPYIVMELVEGSTIRDLLLSADPPSPEQALVIVSGVLEALAYSHQHGIVHRDIKPGNVIITETGAVKVMDFGIARALHGAQSTMTQTGMVMGTPQYLSPEQALGKTVDARSDLYAVGCLLYELLTGQPPFTGETPLSVVYQHVQDEARVPSEVSAQVPPELDGLVMRSLAKDPDDRFQSAEEMRGLMQYALRLLGEQGSHTGGLWNTGPVVGVGAAPTSRTTAASAVGPSHTQETSVLGPPLLMGRPGGDDSGGFDGGPRPGAPERRRGNGVTYALLAVVAVLAVAGGILLALQDDSGQQQQKKPETSTTAPMEEKQPSRTPPTEEPSRTIPDDNLDDDADDGWTAPTDTGDSGQPSWSQTPSQSPSLPSTSPSQSETGTDTGTGEGDDDGTEPGTDAGAGTEPGTDAGAGTGTDAGADAGSVGQSGSIG